MYSGRNLYDDPNDRDNCSHKKKENSNDGFYAANFLTLLMEF